MYLPPHFKETDPQSIRDLISTFPLATLVAHTDAGLLANHIPMLMAGDDGVIGHIALNNDLHRVLADGSEILAIFKGDDAYISPNWYPTKQEHHRHVPTWNYDVVHIHGKIRFQHDIKTKTAVVGRMTKHLETRINGDKAWRMADAPKDYMQTMLDSIVAFSIVITSMTAKAKLSQNRESQDFLGVVENLRVAGREKLAERMEGLQKL